ncbi:MAG TPA: DNA polymerase Y family protein [Oceanospirillaceae bacterium]|nr:DNA polymerase Y family protein [Oceanospirillaceae bacterium]
MQWLYVYLPSLQLDSLLHQQAYDEACVLVHQNQVVQANTQARQLGITLGTGLAAAALLCAQLKVIAYDHKHEQRLLRQLAQRLYQTSATLYLDPPQGLLLQTSDMLKLYKGIAAYWQRLQQPLIERGLHYHYASAHSPLAAQVLARAGNDRLLNNTQEANTLLAQLPIQRVGLAAKLTQQLERLGLNTLGQSQALPRSALGQRLGQELVTYLQQLDHTKAPAKTNYQPPERFRQGLELLYDIELSSALRFPLRRLLDDLEAFLAPRKLQAGGLNLSLHYRELPAEKVHIGCSGGEYRAQVWLNLAMLHLEQLQLQAPIIAMRLSTSGQHSWEPLSNQLFEPQGGKLTADQLISRLQNKLGNHAVQQVFLRDDHRPERSFYQGLPKTHAAAPNATVCLRPSLLLTIPKALHHKPNHQWCVMSGPERIQSGWWDNVSICRDYFIARNPLGQVCWLFRTPTEEWFLHGYFA